MTSRYQLRAIPMFNDNYLWLLIGEQQQTLAVDVGDYAVLARVVQEEALVLTAVLVTHPHHDHCNGLAAVRTTWPNVPIYGHATFPCVTHPLEINTSLTIDGFPLLHVMDTKGHTQRHFSYYCPDEQLIFCGDSLFSAGCGRIFPDGCVEDLFYSLQTLAQLPENTWLCPTHEYTLANLAFAAVVDPDNQQLYDYQKYCQQRRAQQQPTLPVLLRQEKTYNPFLRCHLPVIQRQVQTQTDIPLISDLTTFIALRAWKDRWRG